MNDIIQNIKDYFQNITFAQPWFFLLLALVPLFIWFYIKGRRRKYVEFRISNLEGIKSVKPSSRVKWIPVLFVLRLLCFISIVIAIARPQTGFSNQKITTEGIDICIALDVSPSMYAIDLRPSRIAAAKEAAKNFVDGRPNDRIGLVVFAGEAFTQCPITLDHDLLKKQIDNADAWQLDQGTAMGDGLFMAVSRLADTVHFNAKVIILLTDGVQNTGNFAALDAAAAAKQLNIRVYTIGVGTQSNQPIPVVDKNGREIFELGPGDSFDEPTLQSIAQSTGGEYFHASSKEKLNDIYAQIDKIEKQKVQVDIQKRWDDKFYPFAMAGIAFLLIELLLANTVFRTLT